jgi:RimJ/RimL family protein N-acetyltransferase
MAAPDLPIVTARLVLRAYQPDDLEALHAMFGREDVTRYLPWPPMDLEAARAKLDQRLRQTRIDVDGDALVLAALETATGRHVGEFMLRLTNAESRQGEVGWSLHPDAHGRGLATEGARAMLRVGFEDLGLHRITAGADPRNTGSLGVMDRLGMRREANFVESWFLKGEWVGEVVAAILETEWRASHSGAQP